MGIKFDIQMDKNSELMKNLGGLTPKIRSRISALTRYYSLSAERFAKVNAVWRDRTGNARNTLSARYNITMADADRWEIDISHGMPYGKWLELRFGGKYAIIGKTVVNQGEDYMQQAIFAVREAMSN